MKIWRKPWFLMAEPTAPAIQMAFGQTGSPLIPILEKERKKKSLKRD
jgi:hypothetical protein